MKARTYEFESAQVTIVELAKRYKGCYGRDWLEDAVKAGCKSHDDLTRRFAQRTAAQRAGAKKGRARSPQGNKTENDTLRAWNPGRFAPKTPFKDAKK